MAMRSSRNVPDHRVQWRCVSSRQSFFLWQRTIASTHTRCQFPLETLVSPMGNIFLRSSSIIQRIYHTHTLVQSIIQRHRRFTYLHASSPLLNYMLCPRQLTRQPASGQNKNRNAREKNVGGVALRRGGRNAPKKKQKQKQKQKQTKTKWRLRMSYVSNISK